MSVKPAFFLALAALLVPLAAYGRTSHPSYTHILPHRSPTPTPSPLIIDDFTTGSYSATLTGNSPTKVSYKVIDAKTAIGGKRALYMGLQANANALQQNAHIEVAKPAATIPAALIFDEGLYEAALVQDNYGTELGSGSPPSLHANFSPYDRFRVIFIGVAGGTDFNILAFNSPSFVYTQWACDILNTFSPHTVVDFPFANGTPAGHTSGVNFADISGLIFEFENYGIYSSMQFGISKIELVPAGTPPGDITCPPIGK
jgi:hypothetical protein